MRRGFLGSLSLLAFGAGLSFGQAPGYNPQAMEGANRWNEPVPIGIGMPPPQMPNPGYMGGMGQAPMSQPSDEHAGVPVPENSRELFRFWATAEYFHGWISKDLPPLVTTSVNNPSGIGVIGQPGTQRLFGGSDDSYEDHAGLRATIGYWLGDSSIGVEARAIRLFQKSTFYQAGSDANGNPILSRPIFDAQANMQSAVSISFPGEFSGSVQAHSTSEFLSTEANVLIHFANINGIVGFRYMDLEEDLGITQESTVLGGGLVGSLGQFFGSGTGVFIADQFNARNQFIGGQLGASADRDWGKFYGSVRGVVGLGVNHQATTILGNTSITPPGVTNLTFASGLLTQNTNTGRFTNDTFAVVPEVNVTFGWHLHTNVDLFVGYTFLYWNDVLRPGAGIDRVINPTQLPIAAQGNTFSGPTRPTGISESDLFLHGLSGGLAFRF